MPKKNKPPATSVIEARLDVRYLARLVEGTIALERELPPSKGGLIRHSLETYVQVLVQNGYVSAPEELTIEEALGYLSRQGFFSPNRSGRNIKSLAKQVEMERMTERAFAEPFKDEPEEHVDLETLVEIGQRLLKEKAGERSSEETKDA